ncbi:hypothetical protein MHYP_G00292650 [Metynnis hypsauchen]
MGLDNQGCVRLECPLCSAAACQQDSTGVGAESGLLARRRACGAAGISLPHKTQAATQPAHMPTPHTGANSITMYRL